MAPHFDGFGDGATPRYTKDADRFDKDTAGNSAIVVGTAASTAGSGQAIENIMKSKVRKAVFPVAGMGTRFLPATKAIPKEMLPIVDKPLIQYAVEEAIAAGIDHFIFVTGRSKTAIEDHFDFAHDVESKLKESGKNGQINMVNGWVPKPGQVAYTRQPAPKGLGHAVWCARDLVGDEPFAILLADDFILGKEPCLKQMVRAQIKTGGNIVAVMEVPREHTGRYGVIDIGEDDGKLVSVKAVVEKPAPVNAPSNLCVVGRYILQPEVFDFLEHLGYGKGNEIQLTDSFMPLIQAGKPFHGLRFEGRRYDCGEKGGWLEANIAVALTRPDTADTIRQILRSYC
jgi:UTP--glucose-1-phosphate uridylyltransferase